MEQAETYYDLFNAQNGYAGSPKKQDLSGLQELINALEKEIAILKDAQ